MISMYKIEGEYDLRGADTERVHFSGYVKMEPGEYEDKKGTPTATKKFFEGVMTYSDDKDCLPRKVKGEFERVENYGDILFFHEFNSKDMYPKQFYVSAFENNNYFGTVRTMFEELNMPGVAKVTTFQKLSTKEAETLESFVNVGLTLNKKLSSAHKIVEQVFNNYKENTIAECQK